MHLYVKACLSVNLCVQCAFNIHQCKNKSNGKRRDCKNLDFPLVHFVIFLDFLFDYIFFSNLYFQKTVLFHVKITETSVRNCAFPMENSTLFWTQNSIPHQWLHLTCRRISETKQRIFTYSASSPSWYLLPPCKNPAGSRFYS